MSIKKEEVMKEVKCFTCAFFVRSKKECHYNPPQVVAISTDEEVRVETVWPVVDLDDWCHNWRNAIVDNRVKDYPQQVKDGGM